MALCFRKFRSRPISTPKHYHHHHTPTPPPPQTCTLALIHTPLEEKSYDEKTFPLSILLPKVRDGTTDSFKTDSYVSSPLQNSGLGIASHLIPLCSQISPAVAMTLNTRQQRDAVLSLTGMSRAADLEQSKAFPPSARDLSLDKGTQGKWNQQGN